MDGHTAVNSIVGIGLARFSVGTVNILGIRFVDMQNGFAHQAGLHALINRQQSSGRCPDDPVGQVLVIRLQLVTVTLLYLTVKGQILHELIIDDFGEDAWTCQTALDCCFGCLPAFDLRRP